MHGVHPHIILHPYYIKSYLIQIRGVKNMYYAHPYIILHLDYIKSLSHGQISIYMVRSTCQGMV